MCTRTSDGESCAAVSAAINKKDPWMSFLVGVRTNFVGFSTCWIEQESKLFLPTGVTIWGCIP